MGGQSLECPCLANGVVTLTQGLIKSTHGLIKINWIPMGHILGIKAEDELRLPCVPRLLEAEKMVKILLRPA